MKSHGLDLSLNLITNISSFECQSSQRRIQIRHIAPVPLKKKYIVGFCWYCLNKTHILLIYSNLTIKTCSICEEFKTPRIPSSEIPGSATGFAVVLYFNNAHDENN